MDEQQAGLLAPRELSAEEQEQRAALIEAGNAAFDSEDYDQALECYHHASRIDSSDPHAWSMLGLTYANLDFNQEAWRSYKLALTCDPENLDSLWYASEFLAGVEDYELAQNMLLRYIALEEDEDKRAEANELLAVVQMHVPAPSTGELEAGDVIEDVDTDDEPEDELAGFDLDDEEEAGAGGFDEDEDGYDEDVDYEMAEVVNEQFVASVVLQLNGMDRKCQECSTSLPTDAPYCYNCTAPQFYGRN